MTTINRPVFLTTAHRSYLPGAYDVGAKIAELLRTWGAYRPANEYKAPRLVVQGLDYGHDQDAFACEVSFNRAAGRRVPQRIVSVVPFDANGLGSWAANDAFGARDGHGRLYILNSAPGRNVRNGTTHNVREGFFGAKLKNGAIVVGTISDDLPAYFMDQVETMVEIPLWLSKSQARGIDVFQTIGYAFYQVASQKDWYGQGFKTISFERKDLHARPTPLVMDRKPVRSHGPINYVLSSKHISYPKHDRSHVPVPAGDLRSAGYTAFRLANGGQPQRAPGDPLNVASIYTLTCGLDLNSQEKTGIWAQRQNDGSLVVGPAIPRLWEFSPANEPVYGLHTAVKPSELPALAERLFQFRNQLDAHGTKVPDETIALPHGPIPGRFDFFGNHDVHNADVKLGQRVRTRLLAGANAVVTAIFPVRPTLFQAVTASTDDDARRVESAGFSQQASGGGWLVRTRDAFGKVTARPLTTSQAYVRTDNPEIASASHALGCERDENGLPVVADDLTLELELLALTHDLAPALA